MDKADKLRDELQQKIVEIITSKMETGEMSEARAKEIAKYVLEKLPEGISYQKLMEVIPRLDDHFTELTIAVVPIMLEYERKMKEIIDAKIKILIQQGKLNEALSITKKALEFERSLT